MRKILAFLVVAAAGLVPTLCFAEAAIVKEATSAGGQFGRVIKLKAGESVNVTACDGANCTIDVQGAEFIVNRSALQFEEAEQPAATGMATVNDDVDLYDAPGGSGTIIGMLEEGSTHSLLQCKSDNWCQLDSGWVWGDFLDR